MPLHDIFLHALTLLRLVTSCMTQPQCYTIRQAVPAAQAREHMRIVAVGTTEHKYVNTDMLAACQ